MRAYRLVIRKDGKLLGHFEAEGAQAADSIRDVLGRFRDLDGYDCQLLAAQDQHRILESGPDGLRLVSSTYLFKNVALEL